MNKHVKILLDKFLSEEHLYAQTKAIIDECLSDQWPSNTPFTLYLTAGELRNLYGFYSSKLVMKHFTSAYIGRLLHFYSMEHPSILEKTVELFQAVDSAENRAVQRLIFYFTQKFGAVPPERTRELDQIAISWEIQAQQQVENLIEKGDANFGQSQGN